MRHFQAYLQNWLIDMAKLLGEDKPDFNNIINTTTDEQLEEMGRYELELANHK